MREHFFIVLMKLFAVVARKGLRLIVENPWNTSGSTYLQTNFIEPTIIDNNRQMRGDYFRKPTAYWFVNIEPTNGASFQTPKEKKVVSLCKEGKGDGLCSEERSLISPDYARNFICDFILGKQQKHSIPSLF